jgi:hypothetical protein
MSEVLWTELEKIDILRERMGLTYEEARSALEAAHGDVIKALSNKENEMAHLEEGVGSQLWDGLKHQMNRLSQTQVKLKREDKTLLSVSAPLGMAMVYTLWKRPGLRMLGLLGVAAAAMKHCELEVDRVGEEKEFIAYPIYEEHTHHPESDAQI